LRARGGFRLDATWKNGRPQQIAVRAERSNPCRLVFAGAETATVACDESAVASTYEEGGRSFEAKSEKTYLIRLET
jgi:hypothetical protein